jgi:RsiW-degrading membrane proteinase PrsW (M82 family)
MSSRPVAPPATKKPSFPLIGAFGFAGAAVWVFPVLCGAIALAFALVALYRRERLAPIAIGCIAAAVVVGLLLHLLPASFYT